MINSATTWTSFWIAYIVDLVQLILHSMPYSNYTKASTKSLISGDFLTYSFLTIQYLWV